jgi:hypothetical protein
MDATSAVQIVPGRDESWTSVPEEEWQRLRNLYRTLRNDLSPSLRWQSTVENWFIRPAPATELVYEWLWDDLAELGWVKGTFRRTW